MSDMTKLLQTPTTEVFSAKLPFREVVSVTQHCVTITNDHKVTVHCPLAMAHGPQTR